jgi:beta-hydroxylase
MNPSVRADLFTLMPPHGKTGKHRDPFAGSLRFYLALATPNDDACRIPIDGSPYSWRDGEGDVARTLLAAR